MADPADVVAVDDVRSRTGRDVTLVVASRAELLAALDRAAGTGGELDELSSSLRRPEPAEAAAVREIVDEAPIVKFVNLLISRAVADRASDIHLEPTEGDLRVRFRIDGVLHDVMRSPRTITAGVTSRLKILAEVDIAERRLPQDGRMTVHTGGRTVELRVATLPTVWGEKMVLRILDNAAPLLSLADLGFAPGTLATWERAAARPYGMLLVTGPTGSGKSTTLYGTVNVVSRPEVNVITVEDPVEYRIPGINQVQVNAKAGLTFARALRSILRSDPDVVLLGEIRDHETARIAVEAALTGHLVLSTLHTNDAPSAVTRLVEMGIEPFLVASALDCVLAQRLARRLCERCTMPYDATEAAAAAVGWPADLPVPAVLHRPVGCPACAGTGYRGRVALHEVMPLGEELERLTVERAGGEALGRAARARGMRPLREDGLDKVARGLTTVEEVLRVVV